MRDIKFRGITDNNLKTWVFGSLIVVDDGVMICQKNGLNYTVDPESVGQCTGLCDKDNNAVYEGDILKAMGSLIFVVEFGHQDLGHSYHQQTIGFNATPCQQYGKPSGMGSGRLDHGLLGIFGFPGVEIIGNINENPELLESK